MPASGFLVCLSRILIMHRLGAVVSRLAGAGLITANRVACTNIVCAIPVQVACRHFDVLFGCFVFGLV